MIYGITCVHACSITAAFSAYQSKNTLPVNYLLSKIQTPATGFFKLQHKYYILLRFKFRSDFSFFAVTNGNMKTCMMNLTNDSWFISPGGAYID